MILLTILLIGSFWVILMFSGLAQNAEKDLYRAQQELKELKRLQDRQDFETKLAKQRGEK